MNQRSPQNTHSSAVMQNKCPTIESKTNHKAGRFVCDICDKRFRKPSLLVRHEVVHLSEKPFKCSKCNKQFTQNASLKRHYDEQHGMEKKRHQCTKCGQGFSQQNNLQLHDKKVHPALAKGTTAKRYTCEQCPSVYTNKQTLNKHVNAAHINGNNDKFKLAEAEDDLVFTQNVLEQLKTFQIEMAACEVPIVSSGENVGITRTNANLMPNFPVEVPQHLGECLIDELNLENHVEAQISRMRTLYACEFCGKQFKKSYNFLRHRRVHTQERPFTCPFCESAFSTKTKLHEHAKVHRLDENLGILSKVYPCAVCCQAFSSLRKLDRHTSMHTIAFTLKYKCKICDAIFKTSTALSSHKHEDADEDLNYLKPLLPMPIEVHSSKTNEAAEAISEANEVAAASLSIKEQPLKIKPKWKCPTCGRIFSSSYVLSKHQRIYHGAYSRISHISTQLTTRYKCAYCVRYFKNQKLCNAHMLTHLKCLLNTDANHKSNVINGLVIVTERASNVIAIVKAFNVLTTKQKGPNLENTQYMLTKRSVHLHKCNFCSSQFKKSSDLKRHLLIHAGERLHGCTVCGKSYTLKSTLKEHQLTHAMERLKCVCIVCGRMYSSKKALNVHLRLHTDKQPFCCEQCVKKFRTSGQKIAHMRRVHNRVQNAD